MKSIVSMLFASTLLMSCVTEEKVETEETTLEKNTLEIHKKWELSELDGQPVMGYQPIFIELTSANKINGFTGCNQLTGSYTIENGSQLRFDHLGSTRMACPETEMNLEAEILEALNSTDNFTIQNGKLQLNIGKRAPLAVFTEMSGEEIVNKYWKLSTLKGAPVKMAENQEREQFFTLRSDGSITGFAGCNHFNGTYEIKNENEIAVQQNMAMTLKACPDVPVDEIAYLTIFEQATNFKIVNDVLTLSTKNNDQLAVFEAVYF